MITDRQVRLLRQKRMEGKTQETAAAKAGMSLRSARKWQCGPLPSQAKPEHRWRTRPDPFDGVWEDEIEPLLRNEPTGKLKATTIIDWLAEQHPGRFSASQLRTLQRRLQDWRALREGIASAGMYYVLDVRPDMTVWPLEPTWTDPPYQGNGRPRKPRPVREERQTMAGRSQALPPAAWREITVAQGSQGPRVYRFSAQRVRVTRRRKPGEVLWAVYRQNLDGSEPRYYLSNAPRGHPSGDPGLCGRLQMAH